MIQVISEQKITDYVSQLLCIILNLTPQPLWQEAIQVAYFPNIAKRIQVIDPTWWEATLENFKKKTPATQDFFSAAWQLIFDGWLYIFGYYDPDEKWLKEKLNLSDEEIGQHKQETLEIKALFEELAGLTRTHDSPPLRIAHCIRDLAYGDKSRTNDLVAMVKSDDPAYREIFDRCYWRPIPEEEEQEKKKKPK